MRLPICNRLNSVGEDCGQRDFREFFREFVNDSRRAESRMLNLSIDRALHTSDRGQSDTLLPSTTQRPIEFNNRKQGVAAEFSLCKLTQEKGSLRYEDLKVAVKTAFVPEH
jgi:hypothetical protein